MMVRGTIQITLLSETIFGSGMSLPGGEDVAVKTDWKGRPYLSGSTWKGLLREAAANWLEWEIPPADPEKAAEEETQRIAQAREAAVQRLKLLFGNTNGEENGSWHGDLTNRRVIVSPICLADETLEGEDLLVLRTFTKMDPETGTVASGTLRTAACIRRGTIFQGIVTCAEEDQELLHYALRSIKNVGTLRSRGFGRVCVKDIDWKPVENGIAPHVEGEGEILSYQLDLLEPVRITNLGASYNTYLESCNYIPAAALRGAVMNALSQDSVWFAAHKQLLLRKLSFTDGIPAGDTGKPVIPTPKGFYEDKLGREFYALPVTQKVVPGTKRAKLSAFSTLEKGSQGLVLRPVGLHMGSETRINQQGETGQMFQSRNILPDQTVRAEVIFPINCPEEVRDRVVSVLTGELRLGANVYAGFGRCQGKNLQWIKDLPEKAAYGYRENDHLDYTLYLLFLSPVTLVDAYGEPCGLSREMVSQWLGVEVIDMFCSTGVIETQGFNRTYGTRLPAEMMYDRGSVFSLTCQKVPDLDRICRLERSGIGTGRTEGRGRVLFLRDMKEITGRAQETEAEDADRNWKAKHRRQVTRWLLSQQLPMELSRSQLGTFETYFCRPYESRTEALNALDTWMQQISRFNAEKGTVHGEYRDKARPFYEYVKDFIVDERLAEELGLRTINERIRLLRHLIRLSRKEGVRNGLFWICSPI